MRSAVCEAPFGDTGGRRTRGDLKGRRMQTFLKTALVAAALGLGLLSTPAMARERGYGDGDRSYTSRDDGDREDGDRDSGRRHDGDRHFGRHHHGHGCGERHDRDHGDWGGHRHRHGDRDGSYDRHDRDRD